MRIFTIISLLFLGFSASSRSLSVNTDHVRNVELRAANGVRMPHDINDGSLYAYFGGRDVRIPMEAIPKKVGEMVVSEHSGDLMIADRFPAGIFSSLDSSYLPSRDNVFWDRFFNVTQKEVVLIQILEIDGKIGCDGTSDDMKFSVSGNRVILSGDTFVLRLHLDDLLPPRDKYIGSDQKYREFLLQKSILSGREFEAIGTMFGEATYVQLDKPRFDGLRLVFPSGRICYLQD